MGRRGIIILALLTAAGSASAAIAPPGFDAEQAGRGRTLYAAQCASCHGGDMQGGAGPALAGLSFRQRWFDGQKPLAALFDVIAKRMPPQSPGSLSEAQNIDILAHMLAANGYAPGTAALSATAMNAPLGPPAGAVVSAEPARLPLLVQPAAPVPAQGSRPTDADLLGIAPGNWLTYNRDLAGQRFSPLKQITVANAAKLRPECIFQLGEVGVFQTGPVVFEGKMYVTTARRTAALDAATCRPLWQHDHVPDGPEPYTSNRGTALYDGKIFRGTPDGHLIALDAATGALLWDVRIADSALGQWIAAAPIAIDGRVFVGNAGGIFGANGHIHAFDADSGKRLWTFDLIAAGVESWEKGSETGGGSSWTSMAYDPARKLIYAPVGNPAPVFDGGPRPGNNLYTSSVVVIDAVSGKLSSHVQQTPHDTHDYDTAAAPLLFDQDGASRMAVANKGSWLFLYDRADGNRLVTRQALGRHENDERAPGPEPMRMCPGGAGGAEWNGPAYSPVSRRLYVNAVDWCMTVTRKPGVYEKGGFYYNAEFFFDPPETAFGTLRAFDAATGKPAWVYRSATPMLAGVTPTAGGLIFTGDLLGDFLAIDERTGKPLYRFNTGGAIAGGVVSYAVGGRQFVAVASGNASKTWNSAGAATVVVFALPDR
jgi:alcohol dehydrogenase (cytochrome c)